MIAQAKLTEGVKVARLPGAQPARGKEMIEAIPDAFLVTPTPSLLLCLPDVAMQPAKDIMQIVGAQLTQNAKLEFMLAGIFEYIVPVSLEIAPGDNLSVLSLVLGRIKIA